MLGCKDGALDALWFYEPSSWTGCTGCCWPSGAECSHPAALLPTAVFPEVKSTFPLQTYHHTNIDNAYPAAGCTERFTLCVRGEMSRMRCEKSDSALQSNIKWQWLISDNSLDLWTLTCLVSLLPLQNALTHYCALRRDICAKVWTGGTLLVREGKKKKLKNHCVV